MEFVTYRDLNNDIIENIHKIPENIDLVVGVPRSGMLVATLISLYINKPLSSLDVFIEKKFFQSGKTKNTQKFKTEFKDIKNVLIVEDSVDSGSSILEAKKVLEEQNIDVNYYYLTAYTRSNKTKLTDIYFRVIDADRMFEWNYLHNKQLEKTCFDIDGVLCIDPEPAICSDEKKYLHFINTAKTKLITSRKIGYIVTSRLEKYRKETEEWLKSNNIEYGELFMYKGTLEERKVPGAHANYKASIYKSLKSDLFIESDVEQAAQINEITKKGVFCIDNQSYYNGSQIQKKISMRKKKTLYIIKKIIKNIVGDKNYNKIKERVKKEKV